MSPTPLRVQRDRPLEGLELVRQEPPRAAQSACMSFLCPAGSGFDPRGKEGLALLSSRVATAAAGSLDRAALARQLDRLGATLTSQLAPESVEFTIWGPAKEWRRLVSILSDVALRPRWATDDVARVRRQLVERQMRERELPGPRAERELLRAIFPPGHPYRQTGAGSPRSIANLGPRELRTFHESHYFSNDALLVTTTGAPLASLRREVARCFRPLAHADDPPSLRLPAVSEPAAPRRQVPLPGRSQTDVRMGGPSWRRSAPGYPALFLANEVLGGRPLLSRLFQKVREREGLAYHASSALEAMRFGGFWTVQAGTNPANADRTVDLLQAELDRLRSDLVPPEELEVIRESAIGEQALQLETSADAHELAVDLAYHRLPEDFWEQWPSMLRSVSPADVREAARAGLTAGGAVTVIAGPPNPRS